MYTTTMPQTIANRTMHAILVTWNGSQTRQAGRPDTAHALPMTHMLGAQAEGQGQAGHSQGTGGPGRPCLRGAACQARRLGGQGRLQARRSRLLHLLPPLVTSYRSLLAKRSARMVEDAALFQVR